MLVFSVLSAIMLFLLLLYQVVHSRRNLLFSKIPSPKKRFLLHNTLDLLAVNLEDLFKKFEQWHDELGQIYHLTLHPFDCGIFFIGDAKIAEALSLHQPDRSRALAYISVSRWIGADGFLLSSGNQMKNRMKPILNIFTPKSYQRVR